MPTKTFFNLPPSKREKLLRAAIAEFTRHPYGEVSINRIVQAAEIPRGSFYQYFSDKTDLFQYLLCCYQQQLEKAILSSLDACGGRLLDIPEALFDGIVGCLQENEAEFRNFLGILRQNAGMDARHLWDFMGTAQAVLKRADLGHLNVTGPEEQVALLDLLLSATGQALMAASCGKMTAEESRKRLTNKIAIIRRGAEKEEPLC